MYNEVESNNTDSVGKRKRHKCISVAIVRSKNRARKLPRATKVTINKQIKK